MLPFNEASTRRLLSPWGVEVKKRLIDRSLKQEDLVYMLQVQGYNIDKHALSNLLYGLGASNRQPEIEYISQVLDIPYAKRLQSEAQNPSPILGSDRKETSP